MDSNLHGPINFYQYGGTCVPCYYRKVAFRKPKRGEWFLSGATAEAYLAINDLDDDSEDERQIVVPTFRAKRVQSYAPSDPVVLIENGMIDPYR
jgi:hypothetical protein